MHTQNILSYCIASKGEKFIYVNWPKYLRGLMCVVDISLLKLNPVCTSFNETLM